MEVVTSSMAMNQEDATWLLNSLEPQSIEEKTIILYYGQGWNNSYTTATSLELP